MARIFHPEAQNGLIVSLTKDQQRHLKVLRIKPHEPIQVFDGKGNEFEGIYEGKVSDNQLRLKQVPAQKEPSVEITLAVAAPKLNRIDTLIEKTSELGVTKVIPTRFERSVVLPREGKIERLKRIAIEACAQSGRAKVPEITEMQDFASVLEKVSDYDCVLICDQAGQSLQQTLTQGRILVLIGPEGGVTESERQEAEKAGGQRISLGTTTLRVETAAISVVAQLTGKHL